MNSNESPLRHVSDTALWVAYFRSLETERPDALFRDTLAKKLIGERGKQIAEHMSQSSAHTQYNVLIRTVIIDRFIQRLIAQGADCILNLGAGLDTRPYRLELPATLDWIEVDYPHMVQLKDQTLSGERPHCRLRRVSMDLSDRQARQALFSEVGGDHSKVVILTEGVLPYLTQEQVATLAEDLLAQLSFRHWIADYISPAVYKYLRTPKRMKTMKNAPFRFYPEDWLGFFDSRGWHPDVIEYLPEEGKKLGRRMPTPLVARLLTPFFNEKTRTQFMRMSGYMIMSR